MHNLCTRATYGRFAGTAVETDFVEAPSQVSPPSIGIVDRPLTSLDAVLGGGGAMQMLENWCYEKDVLKRLSSHYQTKEPLPDHLLEKLVKAKHANSGLCRIFLHVFLFSYYLLLTQGSRRSDQPTTDLLFVVRHAAAHHAGRLPGAPPRGFGPDRHGQALVPTAEGHRMDPTAAAHQPSRLLRPPHGRVRAIPPPGEGFLYIHIYMNGDSGR
jgi:hypothetical protein